MKKNIIRNKTTITILLLIMTLNTKAQNVIKKELFKEELTSKIQFKDLDLDVLFQVYDDKSAEHLIGDMYLQIATNTNNIATFYVDKDEQERVYYTKIYKNYFFIFSIENNNNYLIVEEAQLGTAFALPSNGISKIGNENDFVEIEITDFIYERGSTSPFADENSSDDVQYSLKVKTKNGVANFSFYSSEIDGCYTLDFDGYNFQILSDAYQQSHALIEMIINKKGA